MIDFRADIVETTVPVDPPLLSSPRRSIVVRDLFGRSKKQQGRCWAASKPQHLSKKRCYKRSSDKVRTVEQAFDPPLSSITVASYSAMFRFLFWQLSSLHLIWARTWKKTEAGSMDFILLGLLTGPKSFIGLRTPGHARRDVRLLTLAYAANDFCLLA